MTVKSFNIRAVTADVLYQVLDQQKSLTHVLCLPQYTLPSKDRGLLQELSFGCLRTLPILEWCVQQLMKKPFKGKQQLLHYLLMVGIYQLLYTRVPAHAAVADTVNAVVTLKHPHFKGVINGVLRQCQRQKTELLSRVEQHPCRFMHPDWLISRLKQAYPQQWQNIIHANNQKPPLWLRVNRQRLSHKDYMDKLRDLGIAAQLHTDGAIHVLVPCSVHELPGFSQGWISVQDICAQACAPLLEPHDHEQILDLCAAPGGKTTHILEIAPQAHVLAVDHDPIRLQRIQENLQRLQLKAELCEGDGTTPEKWCQGRIFDRILLDVPCSASGVIRRHPDIKWLRRESDIALLAETQRKMLDAIWPYLKPGGILLYTTCSILPQENELQIQAFMQRYPEAKLCQTGDVTQPGWQKLPTENGGDGFFYAKLIKDSSK